MTDPRPIAMLVASVVLCCQAWCQSVSAPDAFEAHRSQLLKPGLHTTEHWWFSTVVVPRGDVESMPSSAIRPLMRQQAQLQYLGLLVDQSTVPDRLSKALVDGLFQLALNASDTPFSLVGVQQVYSDETGEGRLLVLALPRRSNLPRRSFSEVISWLDTQVSLETPAQDPLLLLELSARPASDEAKVRQAIARLYDTTVERLFPSPTYRWSTAPDWVRRSPRPASTTTLLDETPVSRVLELLIERPDDLQVRRRLQRGLRDSGFNRSADLFDAAMGIEWRDGPPPRSELAEVPSLAAFCGIDSAWAVELNLNTNGHLPWATPSRPSLPDEVRTRFDAGDVKGSGRACIDALERGHNPEALSYLSAICFQAKLHHLGAELGRLAGIAEPSLPYAGVNRLRHLMALGDRTTVRAEIDRVAASSAIDAWGRRQIEIIRTWLKSDQR
jgi:hypothetical protein